MTRDWWQTDPTYVIDDPPKGFECPPIFEFCWTNDAREWTIKAKLIFECSPEYITLHDIDSLQG